MSAPTRLLAVLCALASVNAGQAYAQEDERRLVKAGADGRFEILEETATALPGHARAHVAQFRTRLDETFNLLKSMPSVSAPPFPACIRLDSWIWRDDLEPMLMGTVGVRTPEVTTEGRCERKSEASVELTLNSLKPVLGDAHAVSPEPGTPSWHVLPIRNQGSGFIELEGERYILFEPRGVPFRAVSLERYSRHQLKELTADGRSDGGPIASLYRERLKSWTPEQRLSPACLPDPRSPIVELEDVVLRPVEQCPAQLTVMEPDPAYLDRRRPAEIQLIVAANAPRYSVESELSWVTRQAVWGELDRGRLERLIAR